MQSCCGRTFAEQASFTTHRKAVHPNMIRMPVTSVAQLKRDMASFVQKHRTDWATVGVQGIQGAPDFVLGIAPELPHVCADCGRGFAQELALNLHEDLVRHGKKAEKAEAAGLDNAEGPSWRDIEAMVRESLVNKFKEPGRDYCYVWIADISDDWVVFEFKEEYFKTAYSIDDDGKVDFTGKAVEVVRRTVYQPVPKDDDEPDLSSADSAAATGGGKKKNGTTQPTQLKDGKAVFVKKVSNTAAPAKS